MRVSTDPPPTYVPPACKRWPDVDHDWRLFHEKTTNVDGKAVIRCLWYCTRCRTVVETTVATGIAKWW